VSLRHTFAIAFAAVAAIVAVLVGTASYVATTRNLRAEVDRALAQAADTVAVGGAPGLSDGSSDPGPDGGEPGGRPDGQGGSGPDGDPGPGGRDGFRPAVQFAQLVSPQGVVTVVSGAPRPVEAPDLALAAEGRPGVRVLLDRRVGRDTYRVLLQSTGRGAVVVGRDTRDLDRVLVDLAMQTTMLGVGVLAVSALAGWWLARRITRRLLRLTDAAEQVGATGRFDLAMPVRGRDEVGRLAVTLETMLSELARSREDQQRLAQDAGHELRTPLTSLRTNISVLRRYSGLTPSARGRLLDDLDGEARELSSLVDELVELATDRRTEEQAQPVDLAVLTERAAARVRRRSGRVVTVHAEQVTIVGRPQALDRAMTNLLENAMKFDPDSGQPIELHADSSRVEVRDRGPGVAADDAPHVFDRFYRATAARSLPGSGLGLAIVHDVAQLHGGHPYVGGRPGGGAVIGFTLDATERETG
jgi:two-component system sensor histidine kinase MprB